MSERLIIDKQRKAFQDLLSAELPELIKSASVHMDDYDITFTPFPVIAGDFVSEDGTDYVIVRAECQLTNKENGEQISFNVDLLKMPVYHELGFKIKGNYMQLLDSYDRVSGWHFTHEKPGTEKFSNKATAISVHHKSFSFVYDCMEKMYVTFSVTAKKYKKIKVSVSAFLRAVTGMSNNELAFMFGYDNPFVVSAFSSDNNKCRIEVKDFPELCTRDDCIKALSWAVLGKEVAESDNFSSIYLKQREIEKQLFSERYFSFGKSSMERLEYLQSFQYRALGKILAEDLTVGGTSLKEGMVLSNTVLQILDHSDVQSIKVRYQDKVYCLQKLSVLTFRALGMKLAEDLAGCSVKKGTVLTVAALDEINRMDIDRLKVSDPVTKKQRILVRQTNTGALTRNDLLTVFGIWVNNLNGYDVYDKTYDLTNRIMVPFNTKVLSIVREHLDVIVQDLTDRLHLGDSVTSLLSAVTDYSAKMDLDAFISHISASDVNTGQISDMCNIMSFVNKDYKASADIKGMVPADLVNVQDLQCGRTDPFDVPESNKIALVHHRTILARQNEDGYLTSPYLRVENGRVLGDEPVYLTAVEESNKYIAEWNETFLDQDGNPKKTVRARCNGDVVMTQLANVTYKCYSPYQAMSAVHSTIVFPGHSDGKRITMGCNEATQAVPLVNGERPLVNSGGESIVNYGFYYADDVLDQYVQSVVSVHPELEKYADRLRTSRIKLTQMLALGNQRQLSFKVLSAGRIAEESGIDFDSTANFTFPYLVGNYELGMFTYNVNHADNAIYNCGDVVAYSNSCSLEDPGHLDCMDTGAQKLDPSVFHKGLALVKNLVVVYKTFEGSTMDDAITISDELVYDDELTNIVIYRITEPLHDDDEGRMEMFGIKSDSPYGYFGSNGLPYKGTMLNPCDPVICKLSYGNNGIVAHYKYLNPYQKGQVISTAIRLKHNEKYAEVIIADRAVVEVGDKLAGRCGNKGVIGKIVPAADMPFDPVTGLRAQIVLNPLGIPSRQNISQILEVSLSMCLKMDAKISYVSPYNEHDVDFVREQAERHGVHPAVFVDGRTGLPFERPVNYGVISMYKLHHLARKKIHAIGMDTPVDPVFLQPRKGSKNDGGQSFGEMESWCLEGIGATKVLQELYTVQSNDVAGKEDVRRTLEDGTHVQYVNGENHNDATMQCCYRSLCVEFVSNTEENCYEFVPLTDDVIRALSPFPVKDRFALHSPEIFGDTGSLEDRDKSRYKWGWIDLCTEMIHPIWIEKGSLNRLILFKGSAHTGIARKGDFRDIVNGTLYWVPSRSESWFYMASTKENSIYFSYNGLSPEEQEEAVTGMSALVRIFRTADTGNAEIYYAKRIISTLYDEGIIGKDRADEFRGRISGEGADCLQDIMSEIKFGPDEPSCNVSKLLRQYRQIVSFNKGKYSLADYVISAYPVVPQIYRPEFKNTDNLSTPDFDWHYRQILQAVENVRRGKNVISEKQLYDRIRIFSGIGDAGSRQDQKYQNILNYFAGKNKRKSHGKIRQNVQSRRIYRSGRSTIIPAGDTRMTPLQIGIPFTMLVKMYESQLIGLLKGYSNGSRYVNASAWATLLMKIALRNEEAFSAFYNKKFLGMFDWEESRVAYDELTELVKAYLEGRDGFSKQVVLAGRQPSLHKYAIRAFYPLVVYDKVIHVHTLVCAGYNADFDGDQEWVLALISQEAKDEAIKKMSPGVDCINPKNSSVILEHKQDVALGIYCATMLQNNAESPSFSISDIHFYDSLDEIELDLKAGILHTYELVSVSVGQWSYLSTAGRIIFNAIVGGFTDQPFTNTMGIAGIGNRNSYSELQYDGIITCGKVRHGKLRYYNLQDICKELYLQMQGLCLHVYQNLVEFGFEYADKFSVSIGIEDMELVSNKDDMLARAEKLKVAIESDYQDGLISAEDRKDAIITLYNDSETGVHGIVQKNMIANMDRNSNLFIMLDSGARGNASQIMRMCGFLPQLQKDKQTTLETPITTNFYKGLSDFDVHMTSYSVRTGLASTQNETPKAGYATHQVVFMTSGVEIVENDCGKQDWKFDILWGGHLAEKDRFLPSAEWFSQNLLGKVVAFDDAESKKLLATGEDGIIGQNAYDQLGRMSGFHYIRLADGTEYKASLGDLRNKILLKSDYRSMRIIGRMLNNGHITNDCIHAIEKHHLREVDTSDGKYYFWYRMDDCCKSMLLYRIVKAGTLPYTETVSDSTGDPVEIITADTLRYVEENGIGCIQARVLLDCRSRHGICSRCYGLKYSNLEFPAVGECVGTEAAQAIGEPSAQLTISLINKGGVAGASINNGVAMFSSLLRGSLPGSKTSGTKADAVVAPRSGYVHIQKLDDTVVISIEPVDKNCSMCHKCHDSLLIGRDAEPARMFCHEQILRGKAKCQFRFRINSSNVIPLNNEWINAGDPVTDLIVMPDSVTCVGVEDVDNRVYDSFDSAVVYRKKQMIWLLNYFNTFLENNVLINARHFEILARIQNEYVTVTQSDNPDFRIGETYEISQIYPYESEVKYKMETSKRDDVIIRTSGPMTALAFERLTDVAASLVNRCYKGPNDHNNALIGALSIGSDLVTREMKVFRRPKINLAVNAENEKTEPADELVSFEEALQINNSLDDISMSVNDLGSLDAALQSLNAFSFDAALQSLDAFSSGQEQKNTFAGMQEETLPDADVFGQDNGEFMDYHEDDDGLEDSGQLNVENRPGNKIGKISAF